MANVEQAPPGKGPSFVIQIAMLLLMTGAAIGMGWMSGGYLKGAEGPTAVPAAANSHGKDAKTETSATHETGAHEAGAGPTLVNLAPITTNLASPADIWIRLDISVMFDAPQPPELAEQIHQDLLALVRTLKMHQIEGASGYQHLKADLEERAAIRSGGHAKQILIRTLLLE